MVSIAIMGHGVVGSGVAEIFTTHKQKLYASIGEEVYVKKILDLREFPDSPLADRFTKNFEDIINDLEIRVVVEVMGGLNPAYDFVKRCLKAGKSVVTSNKELVAAHGAELLEISKETNTNFLFEASVGGGIPIIRPMSQCLVANNVDEIAGILNGTTNFILTKMIEDGMQFDDALKLAQELGFAERNPAADIEGHDACRKICILASLAYGKHVYPDSVHTEGITKITLEDVRYAEAFHCVIKLIGSVKRLADGKIDIIVAPMLVPNKSQLAKHTIVTAVAEHLNSPADKDIPFFNFISHMHLRNAGAGYYFCNHAVFRGHKICRMLLLCSCFLAVIPDCILIFLDPDLQSAPVNGCRYPNDIIIFLSNGFYNTLTVNTAFQHKRSHIFRRQAAEAFENSAVYRAVYETACSISYTCVE